jgi:multidrug resistance efflux pump
LFDAAVAADELERLTDEISARRSDLERDEAARIARQELERRRALQTQGAAGFNNSYISPDDYSAYLRALEMGREDPYYQNVGTGFSRALGLA